MWPLPGSTRQEEARSPLGMLKSSKCVGNIPQLCFSGHPNLACSECNQHLRQSRGSDSWPSQVSIVCLSPIRVRCQQACPTGQTESTLVDTYFLFSSVPHRFLTSQFLLSALLLLESPLAYYPGVKFPHLIQCFPAGREFYFLSLVLDSQ